MMNFLRLFVLFLVVSILCSCTAKDTIRYAPSRWLKDEDRTPIKKPKVRIKYADADITEEELFEKIDQVMFVSSKVSHGTSTAALSGHTEALNTNNFDEVADSTWFTNRAGRFGFSADDVNDFVASTKMPVFPFTVSKVIYRMHELRLIVKDANGNSFMIRFDAKGKKGISASAEFMANVLLYAAGYNVPGKVIVDNFDLSQVKVDSSVPKAGKKSKSGPLTNERLNEMIARASPKEAGPPRVIITVIPEKDLLGFIPFTGKVRDDLNDRIRHEHRRELRGYRVFSSWFDNTYAGETGTADIFFNVGDSLGYVKHYVFDIAHAFGGLKGWMFEGERDVKICSGTDSLGRIFTFGSYGECELGGDSDRVLLPVESFEPKDWSSEMPNDAFLYMTPNDAMWASGIMMSISEDAIDAASKSALFSSEDLRKYVVKQIVGRRDKIAKYWFAASASLSDFSVQNLASGVTITFNNLPVKYGYKNADVASYKYKLLSFTGRDTLVPITTSKESAVTIPHEIVEKMHNKRVYILRLQTSFSDMKWPMPYIEVYLKRSGDSLKIIGLRRTYRKA